MNSEKYKGMSLVEMLITIVILGIVLLVVSATLTSLIKASAISSARTLSRNESEFILESIRKNIQNAKAGDVFLYNVQGRSLSSNGTVVNSNEGLVALSFSTPIGSGGVSGNEIQIRPTGSEKWICIAWYPSGSGFGTSENIESSYIIRGSSDVSGAGCLQGKKPILLNEDGIIINDFQVKYYSSPSGNNSFVIDLEVIPKNWVPGPQSEFKPEYRRQLVVSTEKLTF